MPGERPILFSAPMVRAILDGRKTVTRRVLNPQPTRTLPNTKTVGDLDIVRGQGWRWQKSKGFSCYTSDAADSTFAENLAHHCPYGVTGERLWVRETWDAPPGSERIAEVAYRADFERDPEGARWRPSIFMPRWASRITLEITSIWAERLQDITEDDAKAEGVTPFPKDPEGDCWTDGKHGTAFEYLWGEINGWTGPKSFLENPWVWVVSFKRIESATRAA